MDLCEFKCETDANRQKRRYTDMGKTYETVCPMTLVVPCPDCGQPSCWWCGGWVSESIKAKGGK